VKVGEIKLFVGVGRRTGRSCDEIFAKWTGRGPVCMRSGSGGGHVTSTSRRSIGNVTGDDFCERPLKTRKVRRSPPVSNKTR
jgi:hypothetical protein